MWGEGHGGGKEVTGRAVRLSAEKDKPQTTL